MWTSPLAIHCVNAMPRRTLYRPRRAARLIAIALSLLALIVVLTDVVVR